MFSAATVWPRLLRTGAAMEISPSSSSWFSRHQPWLRVWRMLAHSASSLVCVSWVNWLRGQRSISACTCSSGNAPSSTRPSEVQNAGRREPTPRLVLMILWVCTRST